MYTYGAGHMGFMSLWWILLAAGIIVLAWVVARAAGSSGGRHDSAEETIRKRYAKGEIDQKTYEDMLRALRR
jgi:uncharacterized membrane protein